MSQRSAVRSLQFCLSVNVFLFLAFSITPKAVAQDLAYDANAQKYVESLAIKEQGELPVTQGFSLEKTLEPTERHRFRLRLEVGQFISFSTINKGIYVQSRLYSADEKLLYEQWRYARADGSSTMNRVIEKSGDYILEIAPRHEPVNPNVKAQDKTGNYQLKIEEIRPSRENELAIQNAENGQNFARLTGARYLTANLDERRRMTLRKEFEPAIRKGEETLQIYQKLLPADHFDIGNLGMALVALYNWRGMFADRQRLEQIWEMIAINRAKKYGINNPHSMIAYHYGGLLANDPVRGERLIKQALDIAKGMVGEKSALTVMMTSSWASKLFEYGEYARSEELFKRAGEIERELPKTPGNLVDIYPYYIDYAEFLIMQGELNEAEKLLLKTLEIAEIVDVERLSSITSSGQSGDRYGKYAKLVLLLGKVAQLKKDYSRAESYFRKLLRFYEVFPLNARDGVEIYRHLGNLYLEQKEFAKSEEAFQQGYSGFRLEAYNPKAADLLRDWSKLKLAQGKIDEAIQMQQKALEFAERELGYALQHASDAEKLKITHWANAQLHEILSLHLQHAPRSKEALRLALSAVLLRKGRVQEEIGQTRAAYRLRNGQNDDSMLEDLLNKQNLYARMSLQKFADNDQEGKELLVRLGKEIESLEIKLGANSQRKLSEFNLDSVLATIPANAALVEYVKFTPTGNLPNQQNQERYLAYLLKADGQMEWFDLGTALTIDETIKKFLVSIQTINNPGNTWQLASQLDKMLTQQIRSKLGNASQVFLAPDGLLNLLPFAALRDEHNRYLLQDYLFIYLTSGRDLLRLQVKHQSQSEKLIFAVNNFGNAISAESTAQTGISNSTAYGASETRSNRLSMDSTMATISFPDLKFAREEGEAIRRIFPEAKLFVDGQALETALKQVRRPYLLHLTMHGFFLPDQNKSTVGQNPENPLLRSGLALAGANQRKSGKDDGLLTAYEAAALDLWGTKLVVLSACETGNGEVKNGEGVFGLRRALVLAGAETQVSSLWKADDKVTRKMMERFYGNLNNEMGRAEALRKAQLEILNGGATPAPYYWANFICIGEWKPLEK